MDNVEIKNLSEAKKEYTQQLINLLKNDIYKGINELYTSVSSEPNYLEKFQNKLREIPKWNQDIIDEKYQQFITYSGCDWLDELLQAVFISNTAILTTVKSKNNFSSKIDLTIPKCSRFLHKCYIETAREIFKNPYLFINDLDYKSTQKNMREALELISISIENSIRNMLPMRDILKQYLTGVEINADKGTDFHLSDETISQKPEITKDQELIEQLENAVENEINNENDLSQLNTEKQEEIDEILSEKIILEKNKLLNENIERLNDINSESEDDDNGEELVDYMKSLNKNIGTETEMKEYEQETLVDNNLETLNEKKDVNIADLSDKNFEQHNLESDNEIEEPKNNLDNNLENEIFQTTNFEKKDIKIENYDNNNFDDNDQGNENESDLQKVFNLENLNNDLNIQTLIPPEYFNDDNEEENPNETEIGKYELNLENLEVNNTLQEANNLIKNFNNDDIDRDIDDMKIDLSNLNEIEDNIHMLTSEKKEPNQIVINLKKNINEKKDNILNIMETSSNDENELYHVDLPDDLK
jgi:hypothetical protein